MAQLLLNKILGRRRPHEDTTAVDDVTTELPSRTPMLLPRPRRLTNVAGTHEQTQSSMIARLPAEIRLIIWEHVIGRKSDRDVLHVESVEGTLRYNRCWEQDNRDRLGFKHLC